MTGVPKLGYMYPCFFFREHLDFGTKIEKYVTESK